MSTNLVLDLARHHVQAYASAAAGQAARAADRTECRAYEEILQQGLNAYQWLRRADETLREADYRGLSTFTSESREAIGGLYRAWLETCAESDGWIRALEHQGCRPENADAVRSACDEARDIVAREDWQYRATHARALSGAQEPW